MRDTEVAHAGTRLSPQEVAGLEAHLASDPEDLEARLKLLGYHRSGRGSKEARLVHALWLIERHPDSEVAASPLCQIDRGTAPDAYERAEGLWLRHLDRRPKDPVVLLNAARFFRRADRDLAKVLLKRGRALEPTNPRWPRELGRLYLRESHRAVYAGDRASERTLAARALELFGQSERAEDPRLRSWWLLDAAEAALSAGDVGAARAWAGELLEIAATEGPNRGNAIHRANVVLGRIALSEGDVEGAKEHLLAAGRTPGSPQLDSFGPNMRLAGELLEAGERGVVLDYLGLCKAFWEIHASRLDEWMEAVRAGSTPEFGANLVY